LEIGPSDWRQATHKYSFYIVRTGFGLICRDWQSRVAFEAKVESLGKSFIAEILKLHSIF